MAYMHAAGANRDVDSDNEENSVINKQPKNICEEAKKKCIYIVLVDQPHTNSLIDNLQ